MHTGDGGGGGGQGEDAEDVGEHFEGWFFGLLGGFGGWYKEVPRGDGCLNERVGLY
jgi:hypothetical protein